MSSHTTVFEQISSKKSYGGEGKKKRCLSLGRQLIECLCRENSFLVFDHVLRMQAGNYMAQDWPRDKGNLQP